jgi:hypothetical protein
MLVAISLRYFLKTVATPFQKLVLELNVIKPPHPMARKGAAVDWLTENQAITLISDENIQNVRYDIMLTRPNFWNLLAFRLSRGFGTPRIGAATDTGYSNAVAEMASAAAQVHVANLGQATPITVAPQFCRAFLASRRAAKAARDQAHAGRGEPWA